jgi:hypothetical protein
MLLNDGFCLRLNENTVISKIYGAHSLILLGVNLIPLSHLYQRKREMPCLFDVIGKVCTYGDDTNYSIQYPKYITINDFTLSKYQNDVHILMTADIYDNFFESIRLRTVLMFKKLKLKICPPNRIICCTTPETRIIIEPSIPLTEEIKQSYEDLIYYDSDISGEINVLDDPNFLIT